MRSVGILYLIGAVLLRWLNWSLMFCVEMNGSNAELREVARAPIMKETLTSDKCFILGTLKLLLAMSSLGLRIGFSGVFICFFFFNVSVLSACLLVTVFTFHDAAMHVV